EGMGDGSRGGRPVDLGHCSTRVRWPGVKGQSRREILGLLEKYDLRPRKEFGQHFLADRNLIDKIVATAEVGGEDKVVEVGAGTGALTVALADTGARVIAYEVDERMRPVLEEVLAGTTVDLRYEDALEADLQSVLDRKSTRLNSSHVKISYA